MALANLLAECIRDSVTSCIREQLFVTCAQKKTGVCVALECYRNSAELPNTDVYKAERNAVQIPKAKKIIFGNPMSSDSIFVSHVGKKKTPL